MLGLTMECARCHDHKFDAITQRDYYSMFAFFNNIDESGLYSHFTNATPSPSLLLWPPEKETQHDLLKARIAAAEAALERSRSRDGVQLLAETRVRRGLGRRTTPSGTRGTSPPGADRPPRVQRRDRRDDARQRLDRCRRSCRTGRCWCTTGSTAALRFSGDNQVVHPGVRPFSRTDPFSLSLRLKPTVRQDRAHHRAPVARVVGCGQPRLRAHPRSRAPVLRPHSFLARQRDRGAGEASAAPEPVVPAGRDLRRVEPRGGHPPLSRRHGGSRPTSCAIICTRTSATARRPGIALSEKHPFTIGARFRDSGFKDGLIDDLQVFDTCLTAAEVVSAVRRDSPRPRRIRALPRPAASAVHLGACRAQAPSRGGEHARLRTSRRSWSWRRCASRVRRICSSAARTTRQARSCRAIRPPACLPSRRTSRATGSAWRAG